jgi:hypothetical protein
MGRLNVPAKAGCNGEELGSWLAGRFPLTLAQRQAAD